MYLKLKRIVEIRNDAFEDRLGEVVVEVFLNTGQIELFHPEIIYPNRVSLEKTRIRTKSGEEMVILMNYCSFYRYLNKTIKNEIKFETFIKNN